MWLRLHAAPCGTSFAVLRYEMTDALRPLPWRSTWRSWPAIPATACCVRQQKKPIAEAQAMAQASAAFLPVPAQARAAGPPSLRPRRLRTVP